MRRVVANLGRLVYVLPREHAEPVVLLAILIDLALRLAERAKRVGHGIVEPREFVWPRELVDVSVIELERRRVRRAGVGLHALDHPPQRDVRQARFGIPAADVGMHAGKPRLLEPVSLLFGVFARLHPECWSKGSAP